MCGGRWGLWDSVLGQGLVCAGSTAADLFVWALLSCVQVSGADVCIWQVYTATMDKSCFFFSLLLGVTCVTDLKSTVFFAIVPGRCFTYYSTQRQAC